MFEDKEITFVEPLGNITTGIVIACEESIGITIVEKYTNRYLYCLILPGSSKWDPHWDKELALKYFKHDIEGIKSGILDYSYLGPKASGGASSSTCPFNQ